MWVLLQQFVFVGWHLIFWIRVAFDPFGEDLNSMRPMELIFDSLFFLDVILKFFTGIPVTDSVKYQNMKDKDEDNEYGYIFDKRKIAI